MRETEYVETAELVVIRAETSEGVMWEVERVDQHARPETLLIYVLRGQPDGGDRLAAC